jgi:hypothetical protein
MGKLLSGKNGGFLMMVLSVLGVVLWVTLFSTILDAFVTLYGTGWTNYIAFATICKIVPTILFLAGIFGAGFGYYKGYTQAQAGGINSLLLMVFGALEIILFVTLFATIMTGMETLRTHANVTLFIAMSTVVSIAPTVLFLAGIFAGGATAVGGWRKRKKSRALV